MVPGSGGAFEWSRLAPSRSNSAAIVSWSELGGPVFYDLHMTYEEYLANEARLVRMGKKTSTPA